MPLKFNSLHVLNPLKNNVLSMSKSIMHVCTFDIFSGTFV